MGFTFYRQNVKVDFAFFYWHKKAGLNMLNLFYFFENVWYTRVVKGRGQHDCKVFW